MELTPGCRYQADQISRPTDYLIRAHCFMEHEASTWRAQSMQCVSICEDEA